jgi:hypothetical protein
MNDYRNVLERDLARVGPAPFDLDDVARRRDRKRRNQRIAAGVVGIAVFVAAVWIVTSLGSLDRSQTSVVPGGEVTGPAETGPAETGSTAAPASAGEPDVQEPATCQFVQPRARAHLELTTIEVARIRARFVLHQMTHPGHRWRIVMTHAHGIAPDEHLRVIFEGIRLATGDSGDITVERTVRSYAVPDWFTVRARDRQTGQRCTVMAGL